MRPLVTPVYEHERARAVSCERRPRGIIEGRLHVRGPFMRGSHMRSGPAPCMHFIPIANRMWDTPRARHTPSGQWTTQAERLARTQAERLARTNGNLSSTEHLVNEATGFGRSPLFTEPQPWRGVRTMLGAWMHYVVVHGCTM